MLDGGDGVADPYSYTLPFVSAGIRDLLALEWNQTTGAFGNYYIERNINVAGNLVGQDVDFTTDGEALTFTNNIFSGSAVGQWLEVYYATSNGTSIELLSDAYDGSTSLIYPYLTNAPLKQTGDTYSFQIASPTYSKFRVRNKPVTNIPGTQNISLDDLASLSGTIINGTQTTGLSYTPDSASFSGSPVFRGYQIDLDQTTPGVSGGAHWKIMISDAWLGASSSYTHPSLSAISGFDTGWDMSSGKNTYAIVSAVTTNSGTSLNLLTRKTIGRDYTANLDSDSWVVVKKLAHKDTLEADFAYEYSQFNW
jgi:hypothetical protein